MGIICLSADGSQSARAKHRIERKAGERRESRVEMNARLVFLLAFGFLSQLVHLFISFIAAAYSREANEKSPPFIQQASVPSFEFWNGKGFVLERIRSVGFQHSVGLDGVAWP
jgi:hypothetical protein